MPMKPRLAAHSQSLAALVALALFALYPAWSVAETGESPVQTSEAKLLDEAAEIGAKVGRIRGLELKEEIIKGVKNRDELREVLIEKLAEGVTDEEIEAEAKIFKRMGLFRPEIQYKQLMLDLLTEQIAGFYDQSSKELYIMKGIPQDHQRSTIAHEIFHAIQDQHFDIGRMLAPFSSEENSDFALARMALIEGDATVLMIDFTLYESGVLPQDGVTSIVDIPMMAAMLLELDMQNLAALEQMVPTPTAEEDGGDFEMPSLQDSVLVQAPAIIQELLVFPYVGGLRFVIMARSGNTWDDVDAIYARAPVSTEQILHPERYFAGDWPVHIEFNPAKALTNHKKMYETVLGEFQLRAWLNAHLGRSADEAPAVIDVAAAAEGWGGDRLLGWEDESGRTLITHLSSWDTPEDTLEFYEALVEMTKARYPDGEIVASSGKHGQSICVLLRSDEGNERLYVEQWGDLVLYIEGAPSVLDENDRETDPTVWMVRDEVWKTFSKSPFEDILAEREAKLEEEAQAEKQAETRPSP
ncbi:MAG: hypothetical protein ACNA8W_02000 [Bradymonadaceae bacterium]